MNQPGILKKQIAITMGDPNGIGPEVAAKALADPQIREAAGYLLIGSVDVFGDALDQYAQILSLA